MPALDQNHDQEGSESKLIDHKRVGVHVGYTLDLLSTMDTKMSLVLYEFTIRSLLAIKVLDIIDNIICCFRTQFCAHTNFHLWDEKSTKPVNNNKVYYISIN